MTQSSKRQSQQKVENKRRILPPQVDEDVTFGIMWIRVGKLKLIRGKSQPDNKVVLQFWGEKQPVYLQTKSNPLNINQADTMIEYDIKCPITYFKDYLMDMKKNLRLEVQDVGKVDFDITKFLKPNVDLTSRYVFDHFKGAFQIIGQHKRKLGTIELEMACNFNPELTALQLGSEDQSLNINNQQKIQRKIAIQNPQLYRQFYEDHIDTNKKQSNLKSDSKQVNDDNRIPNSLYTQMSPEKFNPALYLKEQQKIKTNKATEQKMPQPSQNYVNIVLTKAEVKQKNFTQKSEPVKDQQVYKFPTIAKVLTYSNLRLAKGLSEEDGKSEGKQFTKNKEDISIEKIEFYQEQSLKKDGSVKMVSLQKVQQRQISIDRAQSSVQMLPKQENLSDIKRPTQQSQSNLLDEDKQILSRVVNLDNELKKSEIHSPGKKKEQIYQFSPQKVTNQISQKENDIRPITQYSHPDVSYEKPLKEGLQVKYPPTQSMKKIKPSSLVLNLLVEIETKSINFTKKKQKFNLIHRPYGCKERIKLGPKFESDKIMIMCPVSEELVSKMDKMPFIVQFWGAVTNQFLGFIKIDLSKIKKGFMLQGRLNEIAIKSSLMPIIIQQGEVWIENVNGERSGECSLYAGIGTSAQVALYMNTDRRGDGRKQSVQADKQQIERKQKREQKRKPLQKQQLQSQQLQLQNIHFILTNFLYLLDMNSAKNIQHISELMRKKQVTSEEFEDFVLAINPKQDKVRQLIYVFRNCVPFININQGEKQKQTHQFIHTNVLKSSFDQYKQLQQSLTKQFNKVNKLIQQNLTPDLKQQINKQSSFNIIEKEKFKKIYVSNLKESINGDNQKLQLRQIVECYYLQFFDQFINTKTIFSQEKWNSYYQPTQKLIIEQVKDYFIQTLIKKGISVDYLEICLKETKKESLGKRLERFCKEHLDQEILKNITLWYWLCLTHFEFKCEKEDGLEKFIGQLRQEQRKIQKLALIKEKIATYQAQKNERKAFESVKKAQETKYESKQQPKPQQQQIAQNQSIGSSITDSNLHNILNQHNTIHATITNNQSVQQSAHFQKQERQQFSNVLIEKQNVDVSNSQLSYQGKGVEKQREVIYYEHVFEIKGVELFMEHPVDGEYVLMYRFPYEQESIGSKKIRILPNKHRYAISLYGQHRISIEGDIHEYLNEVPVKFQLIKIQDSEKQGIELQGDLHSDDLILSQQSELPKNESTNNKAQKVVLLFGQDTSKVQAKVKLELQYEHKQSPNPTLGKQTVYNLFLPKAGFVNFLFQLKLEEQKIKSQFQLDIGEEFYVSITVDMFNDSKILRPHYPPVISQLYSNLNEEITFCTVIKLTLNPNILAYIKQHSCLVSLNLIYYSKSKGNYQKNETTFATLKIPLFNLIQSQGISGNYAFKNKYGMFIALCKTIINYDKHEKKPLLLEQSQNKLSFTNMSMKNNKFHTYWVMIHFKELINFEDNVQTTFVKFETVMNAQKYQTQKIHLSDDPLLIFNDLIVLPLTEEQFFSTKIIPISILFDQNQKFALDISMRPILRKITKQNYSVNGGYFLVVDEQSQMTKMRVGARVIAFKGSSTLQPFINAYANNINIDVLSQVDFKRDIENYKKLLDVFKSELKLSKKSFQESLKQLITNKNEKLPLQLMTSQLLYKLDLTPIVAESEDEVDSMVRNIDGVASEKKLCEFIDENGYKLTNFHSQILAQYSFESLWPQKIDKNVQYFNLKKQIDTLTLARKIRVIQSNEKTNNQQQQQEKYKQIRITLKNGTNFHYLYNGIKPNVLVKTPQLSWQSKVKLRSSEPEFNQSLREIVDKQKQDVCYYVSEMVFRALRVEVYHVATGRRGEEEEILIGEGKINVFSVVNLANPKQQQQEKSTRIIISSVMSSKMKATLQITLQLSLLGQHQMPTTNKHHPQHQNLLQDASRIQHMIKQINKQMDDKLYMFQQSSDDDDDMY